jgi:hypothetical protein
MKRIMSTMHEDPSAHHEHHNDHTMTMGTMTITMTMPVTAMPMWW